MPNVEVREAAALRIDEIYRYTRDHWGTRQADRYIIGLFAAFDGIESRQTLSKPIPAEFGIAGYFFRYERHVVYWRWLANGNIGIVTILHERMHLIERFKDEFGV